MKLIPSIIAPTLSLISILLITLTTSTQGFTTLSSKSHFSILPKTLVSSVVANRRRRRRLLLSATVSNTTDNTDEGDVTWDWKDVATSVFLNDKRPIVLFDGVCNLCNGGVNYALDHDLEGCFRFVSLQSKVGRSLLLRSGKKPGDISSIVLITERDAYFKSDAVVRICRKLDYPAKTIGAVGPFFPGFLRDIALQFVADNRYRFGEADQCRLWDDNFEDRFIPDP